MQKVIFILGDLVLDHTVFLVDADPGRHNPIEGEALYQVVRRQDMPGGAANSARILSVLNAGPTYLWGIHGQSNWGEYRDVLKSCEPLDNATSSIEFRAVADESGAPMNTITRLIRVGGHSPSLDYDDRQHRARFDDYGHLHISEEKRMSARYYLERVYEKHGRIDAIVLNDLDMGSLTTELVENIATFANDRSKPIPLFVDPKREMKYSRIQATAILPNLKEWCHLVRVPNEYENWRRKVANKAGLVEMAHFSSYYLPGFTYHIITCDELGSVIIGPHPTKPHSHAVYLIAPAAPENLPHQLGCGDLITAIFAAEYDPVRRNAIEAFLRANAVVGAYRRMPWNQMPSVRECKESIAAIALEDMKPNDEPSDAILYLPAAETVSLQDACTSIPSIFSTDDGLCEQLALLVEQLRAGISDSSPRSFILTAPAGFGKTTILNAIPELLRDLGTIVEDLTADFGKLASPDQAGTELANVVTKLEAQGREYLIIIDEVLKGALGARLRSGDIAKEMAMAKSGRFMFVDTAFHGRIEDFDRQTTRRCEGQIYEFAGIDERPSDIPYIVGSKLLEDGHVEAYIEASALLAFINMGLKEGVTSTLSQRVRQAYEQAIERGLPPGVCIDDLPPGRQWLEETRLPAFVIPKYKFVP